jgi:hypothetical protein
MGHMKLKVAHCFEGPGTTHPAISVTTHNTILDYTCENLKIHNNNVIALTFIRPNTQVSTIKSGWFADSERVHDNRINATATENNRHQWEISTLYSSGITHISKINLIMSSKFLRIKRSMLNCHAYKVMLNENILINVRCKSCRHFSKKWCKCWRVKIN